MCDKISEDRADPKKKIPQPPMRQIMTTIPFLVVCIAMMGKFWGYYTIIAGIPQYFLAIHHVSLEKVNASSKIVLPEQSLLHSNNIGLIKIYILRN